MRTTTPVVYFLLLAAIVFLIGTQYGWWLNRGAVENSSTVDSAEPQIGYEYQLQNTDQSVAEEQSSLIIPGNDLHSSQSIDPVTFAGDSPANVIPAKSETPVISIETLMSKGNYAQAEQLLSSYIATNPEDASKLALLAMTKHSLEKYREEQTLLIKLLEYQTQPDAIELLHQKLARSMQKYTASRVRKFKYYEELLLVTGSIPLIELEYAKQLIFVGKLDAALPIIDYYRWDSDYSNSIEELESLYQQQIDRREATKPVVLPLQKTTSGWVVSGRIKNNTPITLLLRTGHLTSGIHESVLKLAGVNLSNQENVLIQHDGDYKSTPIVNVDGFGIPPFLTNRINIEVLKGSLPGDVDGYLGQSYLQVFNLELDSESAALLLKKN